MADFTSEEIQSAVEQIVRSSIRRPIDALGVRRVDIAFSDFQEAAAGVFLLYFNAPFYVLFLGAQRLNELIQEEASIIEGLIGSIQSTKRVIHPIKDISTLANARAALFELEGASESRSEAFPSLDDVPAWRRYTKNIDSFLSKFGPNIKESGTIVDTPPAARSKIPDFVRALQANHSELVRRAKLLAEGLSNFESLNIPSLVAQGVIGRSRQKIDERFEELEALDEVSRLEILRDVTLDLVAQKAVVRAMGSAKKPSPFLSSTGSLSIFADENHPAIPAEITSTIPAPYSIVEANSSIEFTMDGGPTTPFLLPLSFVSELLGQISEPYEIMAGVNDELILEIYAGSFSIPLPVGSPVSGNDVVVAINTALAGTDVEAELYFRPLKYDSVVNITSLGGTQARFTAVAGDFLNRGIEIGDVVLVTSGANVGSFWTITGFSASEIDTNGSGPVIPELGQSIQVGPADRSIRIFDTDPLSSVNERRTILVGTDGDIADEGATTLGFFPLLSARSRPSLAEEVVSAINGSLSGVRASVVEEVLFSLLGRTKLDDPLVLVLYRFSGRGDVDGTTPGQITITGYAGEGTVSVGDRLVLRSGLDTGSLWEVVSVSASSIVATTLSSPTASSASGIEFEAAPVLNHDFGMLVRVLDGPNNGLFRVQEPALAVPFEVQIDRPLPLPKTGGEVATFSVELSEAKVRFSSVDTSLLTEIEVEGPAASLFFSTTPAQAVGKSPYVQFTNYPKAVVVGDFIDVHLTYYKTPNVSLEVVETEPSLSVLKTNFDADLGTTVPVSNDQPPPFVRIRVGKISDASGFISNVNAWLERSENQPGFFTNLNRFINPLLVNKNPTAVQVDDAETEVRKLQNLLVQASSPTPSLTLEFVIGQYRVEPVEAVDVLLKSFREAGADRAIDVLLEGRFSDFFGLSEDSSSYSGQLLSSIRDLARQDLPVRRFDREETHRENLIASVDSPDFEFDTSDADPVDIPELPTTTDL